jgi:hypothetical protein
VGQRDLDRVFNLAAVTSPATGAIAMVPTEIIRANQGKNASVETTFTVSPRSTARFI